MIRRLLVPPAWLSLAAALCPIAAALWGCTHSYGGPRGGGNPSYGPSYGPPPGGGACWPVAPLQLQALEHGRDFEGIAAVAADGSLLHAKGGSMGVLRGDVLQAPNGQMSCQGRQISIRGRPGAFYSNTDELVIPNEITIFVADDGMVFLTARNRRVFGPPGSGAAGVARVVGPVAAARRTAELLVLLSLGGPP